MSGGVVDRPEWAKVVNELLSDIPRRNKAELSRRIGFTERTIDRWLQCLVNVDEASVRQVAERTGQPGMELLIRVGYYRREELPVPEIPAEDAWIVEIIQGSKVLTQDKKDRLIAIQLEQARREREEKKRRLEEQIEFVGGSET